ncbi:unnamed protein product [Sphagnum jensenii]|uniref:PRA1 family protein n=1 Tax=Sphagnum jensenii TaxID=128206 RepID=A0ABP0VZA8_9BRYO
MAFERNPLSLSLPQAAFEKWLRDSGYLEILDRCVLDHARIAGQGSLAALSKVIKINPFVNLTVEDLLQKPVSWTGEFFDCGLGPWETFSWPRTITQVKLRMEENVKRYTGNYLILVLIIFLCFLYKMPLAFVGVASIVSLWDTLRKASDEWGLERTSFRYRSLVFLSNIVTVVLMVFCKIAVALCWAGITSFLVVTMHSCLRRITSPPTPQSTH